MGNTLVLNDGSVAVETEGTQANGTIQVINNTFDGGEEIKINGATFTEGVDFIVGGSVDLTAAAIQAAIAASTDHRIVKLIVATVVTDTVTIKARHAGTRGNLIEFDEDIVGGTDNLTFTPSGGLLTGGLDDEGTYKAEQDASAFIEVLEDGLEFTPSKELLERNNRTSTVETVPGKTGIKQAAAVIPVELKAGETDGTISEIHPLLLSLFGGFRQGAQVTSGTGHSSTVINIPDSAIGNYKVGDCVKVEEAGAHHLSPITVVDDTPAAAKITLRVPRSAGSFTDNVVIAPFSTYFHKSGAETVSATQYIGGEIREKAIGMRTVTVEVSNFVTGQLGELPFNLEGLSFDREVGTPLFTPDFDILSEPPVILNSKIFQDTTEIELNELGITYTNTVGFKTATGDADGRIGSRITEFAVAGTFNPYTEDDDVARFDLFDSNSAFALFAHTQNDDSVAGELKQVIMFNFPNCRAPEIALGDQEGLATDEMSFTAHRTLGNDTAFLSFV